VSENSSSAELEKYTYLGIGCRWLAVHYVGLESPTLYGIDGSLPQSDRPPQNLQRFDRSGF
jgi:hypothetical protein